MNATTTYTVHDGTGVVVCTKGTLQEAIDRCDELTRDEPGLGPYLVVRLVPVQVYP